MTELIPGKRYRSTITGTATESGGLNIDGVEVWIHAHQTRTLTFELLPDPLPTTPGSVILDRNDSLWRLINSGTSDVGPMWCALSGARAHASTLEQLSPFTVLLDAGAERA